MSTPFSAAIEAAVGDRPCVVALGGGADSAMVLHAAASAKGAGEVRAVFVDHALPSSEDLKEAATRVAAQCGVDLVVLDAPVVDGSDLEARSRRARYRVIESDLGDIELALTGHTADDQAETVLMRVMRGSGAGGLAGIPAVRGPWRRPFLAFRRDQLRAAADELGLAFVDDPANFEDRFLRSRIRHHLLPLLDDRYAPGIVNNLVRTGGLLRDDDELLVSLTGSIPVIGGLGEVAIAAPPLLGAPKPVATRAIRAALRRCVDVYPGSMSDVETVLTVARTGETAFVSGHVEVRSEPPFVVLGTAAANGCDASVELDGSTSFSWNGARYRVSTATYPTPVRTAGRFTVVTTTSADRPLGVRGLREGDRLDIGSGSTPVTELLRDHGAPPASRPYWPVVTVGGKIAAVHGVRTASWAKARNGNTVTIIEREVHS